MKYKVIKNSEQYYRYCEDLERLLTSKVNAAGQDEIDLLTLLIESYDAALNRYPDSDPISLLRSFMTDHHLKQHHLVELLGVSKGYVSDILNYKKGLSKELIRKLAKHFKVRQEAFNRSYPLCKG
jgi:HTH-type transcriptional regulator/antitoxin HigA